MNRLNRQNLADAAFDVVLRGYGKRQVDERLRFLSSELAAAEKALLAATQRATILEELNEARAASGGEPLGDSNFGARVEKILKLAQDEAREVRSQAEAAAAALIEQARTEAAEQRRQTEQQIAAWRAEANRRVAEQDSELQRRSAELDNAHQELERESEQVWMQARAEADQIRKAVAHEAEELFKAARADADEVCRVARVEAEQLLTHARTEADRLIAAATDTAQQRERSSAHELHQLSRLHEEINADLYRAKEALDSLFGASPGAFLPRRCQDGAQSAH
ncbi:MAG: hypothetical protein M3460_03605 [Actinomycetota bacterium]|nr:hypothetical protein [Actinomycetota bacterium]